MSGLERAFQTLAVISVSIELWLSTSVVSTLTGSEILSVAVTSGERKQDVRCKNFFSKKTKTNKKIFLGNSHTDANVFLVTRFCWLRLSLRLSHHRLLLGLHFLLTGSILMSLHSIKVATEQHFLQSVLQWLVWNKEIGRRQISWVYLAYFFFLKKIQI